MTNKITASKLLLTLAKQIKFRSHVRLALVLFLIVIATGCAIYLPLLLTQMVDSLQAGHTKEHVLTIFYWLVGTLIIGRLCMESKFQIYAKWESQLIRSTLQFFHQNILFNRPKYFEENSPGKITSRLILSTFGLKGFLFDLFFSVLPLFLEMGMIVPIIMHQMDILLGLTLFTGIGLYLIVMITLNQHLQLFQREIREATIDAQGCLTDHFSSWKDILLLNGYTSVSKHFAEHGENLAEKTERFYSKRSFFGIIQALLLVTTFLLTNYLTIQSSLRHTTTIGGLVLINSYLFQLLRPLESFGLIYRSMVHSFAEYCAIIPALAKKPRPIKLPASTQTESAITLSLHQFSKSDILSPLDITWSHPSRIALVGKSGSGKSTILNAIAGLDRNYQGSILLNGIPLTKDESFSLHPDIMYFPSDARLLSMTVLDNLLISHSVTQNDLEFWLDSFNLKKRILKLGKNSQISESTTKLSTGEKQRLKLIRGLLAQKPIWLLDESTSALDPLTESKLIDTLFKNHKGIMIYATHKYSNLHKFDTILLIDKGKLIESGSHQSLMEKKGDYFKLWSTHQSLK